MAVVNYKIDPDMGTGYDYASINACVSAIAGDQSGNDIHIKVTVTGAAAADTAAVTLSGFTNYAGLTIEPYDANGTAGTAWSTSKYRMSCATTPITVSMGGWVIKNIQLETTSTTSIQYCIYAGSAGTGSLIVNGNFCRANSYTGSYKRYGLYVNQYSGGYVINNIVEMNGSIDTGIFIGYLTLYLMNNTVYNIYATPSTSRGIDIGGTGKYLYNNVVGGNWSSDYYNIAGASGAEDYNAETQTNLGGANSLSSQTDSNYQWAGSNDYAITTSSVLKNAGTDTSSYNVTTDQQGTSRPQGGTYDIGAYEFPVAGGSIPIFAHHLNHNIGSNL